MEAYRQQLREILQQESACRTLYAFNNGSHGFERNYKPVTYVTRVRKILREAEHDGGFSKAEIEHWLELARARDDS